MDDRPFGLPPDIELDLPAPPSVNLLRKIDWKSAAKRREWRRRADSMVLATRGRSRSPQPHHIAGQFEALVVLSEKHTRIDLDNCLKELLDFAKHAGLIVDDGPRYFRRLVVEWGYAPEGCRLILRPREPN